MTQTSVIIPAYGDCPHLSTLLRALLDGSERPCEIIVSHSGPHDPTQDIARISGAVIVLHHSERLLGGAARNRGAAVAKCKWLTFIDADVRPRKEWLQTLLVSVRRTSGRFVIGSVGYATSGGYWGICNWLCEFNEQAPWHPARAQIGGASCNMIVEAVDFRKVNGFPEEYQPGEDTMLFSHLRAMGREQWFEPAARVDHHNQAGLRSFAQHQYQLGIHSAIVRQRVVLRGSLATRIWPLALVLWIPRLGLLALRLFGGGPKWWLSGVACAPGLVLGSWFWTAGFLKSVLSSPAESELPPARHAREP